MKQITVSAAVIIKKNSQTGKNEVFATQRGYGNYKGGWEFPGGKLEEGETPEQCIMREIKEELATEVEPEELLGVVEYAYPEFNLKMYCILCRVVSGNLELLEHSQSTWLTKENLYKINWLPADLLILNEVEKKL